MENDKSIDKEKIGENESTEKVKKEQEGAGKPKKFYTELWFILTVCAVAFVLLLTTLILIAGGSGLTLKNMFGGKDEDLDFINDSLDRYINIKESDYKNYEIEIPIARPGEAELKNEINKLIAANRAEPLSTKDTYTTSVPIKVGNDIRISYLGYQLDDAGRKLLVSGASNYESANTELDRFTVGLNSTVFGIGFEEALVGKMPNGALTSVRGYGNVVSPHEVIYATVSFVLGSGLVYDEVDVCIDPRAEDFERCWGIGFYEILVLEYPGLGQIYPTGNSYRTFELEGGGDITYTSLKVNYISSATVAPITVESYFGSDYTLEGLRNEKVYFDVYVKDTVEYNVPEFDESFITEKLKHTETSLSGFEGEGLVEKCKSYYMQRLNDNYKAACQSYAEDAIWKMLKSNVKVTMYPQNEVDRIYIGIVEDYSIELAEANAAGAGYTSLDEYMAEVLGLEEGAEWTSVLLESVKETVKERLIVYAVLKEEGILPVGEAFDKIYEEELKKDYEYAKSVNPGQFETLEAFREYIENERGEEYKHSVYYYYATEKFLELATLKYN